MESISIKLGLLIMLQAILAKAASIAKQERSRDGIRGRPYYMAHACERTILHLDCGGDQKIHLAHAMYGRQDMDHCNDGRHGDAMFWSNHCTAPVRRTTRVVAEMCNGQEKCVVPVVNYLFSDPCPTTYKYLQIYYTCVHS